MPNPFFWRIRLRATLKRQYQPNPAVVKATLQQFALCPLPHTPNAIRARELLIAAIEVGAVDAVQRRPYDDEPYGVHWSLHLAHIQAIGGKVERRGGWRLLDEWLFTVELATALKSSTALLLLYLDGAQPHDCYDNARAVWRLGAI